MSGTLDTNQNPSEGKVVQFSFSKELFDESGFDLVDTITQPLETTKTENLLTPDALPRAQLSFANELFEVSIAANPIVEKVVSQTKVNRTFEELIGDASFRRQMTSRGQDQWILRIDCPKHFARARGIVANARNNARRVFDADDYTFDERRGLTSCFDAIFSRLHFPYSEGAFVTWFATNILEVRSKPTKHGAPKQYVYADKDICTVLKVMGEFHDPLLQIAQGKTRSWSNFAHSLGVGGSNGSEAAFKNLAIRRLRGEFAHAMIQGADCLQDSTVGMINTIIDASLASNDPAQLIVVTTDNVGFQDQIHHSVDAANSYRENPIPVKKVFRREVLESAVKKGGLVVVAPEILYQSHATMNRLEGAQQTLHIDITKRAETSYLFGGGVFITPNR